MTAIAVGHGLTASAAAQPHQLLLIAVQAQRSGAIVGGKGCAAAASALANLIALVCIQGDHMGRYFIHGNVRRRRPDAEYVTILQRLPAERKGENG